MTTALLPVFAPKAFAADAIALPSATPFPALPAVGIPVTRRRSLLSVIRHRASLIYALTMLGSSAAYCVYALGHMA